jgi:hypothetical protein
MQESYCSRVICSLSESIIFFHIISLINAMVFEKKNIIEHKICFDFLYGFCLKYFSF